MCREQSTRAAQSAEDRVTGLTTRLADVTAERDALKVSRRKLEQSVDDLERNTRVSTASIAALEQAYELVQEQLILEKQAHEDTRQAAAEIEQRLNAELKDEVSHSKLLTDKLNALQQQMNASSSSAASASASASAASAAPPSPSLSAQSSEESSLTATVTRLRSGQFCTSPLCPFPATHPLPPPPSDPSRFGRCRAGDGA